MPIITSDRLHALSRAVCAASGSAEREATLVADHLVEANLCGHDSHGVGLLPIYLENARAGRLVPNRHAELVSERGAVLVIEGNRGYGQVIGHEAMQLGMARARDQGAALLALRNSFHLGRIGHFAEQCARDGFASIHFVNVIDHAPLQAPYGGAEARFTPTRSARRCPARTARRCCSTWRPARSRSARRASPGTKASRCPRTVCSMPLADRPAMPQ
jgi:uncharacterized oxidoreductase